MTFQSPSDASQHFFVLVEDIKVLKKKKTLKKTEISFSSCSSALRKTPLSLSWTLPNTKVE